MDAKEKDIRGPVFEFFGPRKKKPEYGIGQIQQADNGLVVVYGVCGRGAYKQFYPRELITSISPNDLCGITICFSLSVKYNGNFGGGHQLDVSPFYLYAGDMHSEEVQLPHFGYDHIARVKKPSGEVVWENYDVPKRKRVLKEEPAK